MERKIDRKISQELDRLILKAYKRLDNPMGLHILEIEFFIKEVAPELTWSYGYSTIQNKIRDFFKDGTIVRVNSINRKSAKHRLATCTTVK